MLLLLLLSLLFQVILFFCDLVLTTSMNVQIIALCQVFYPMLALFVFFLIEKTFREQLFYHC